MIWPQNLHSAGTGSWYSLQQNISLLLQPLKSSNWITFTQLTRFSHWKWISHKWMSLIIPAVNPSSFSSPEVFEMHIKPLISKNNYLYSFFSLPRTNEVQIHPDQQECFNKCQKHNNLHIWNLQTMPCSVTPAASNYNIKCIEKQIKDSSRLKINTEWK